MIRRDLVGPRPLGRPSLTFGLVKGSPEWYAPFKTDEISKSDPFSMSLLDSVEKAIYGEDSFKKATEGATVVSGPAAKRQAAGLGFAPTKVAQVPTTQTKQPAAPSQKMTRTGVSGNLPDVSSKASVSSPEHKLAAARGFLDHHAFEYHRNTQMAGDTTLSPEHRAQAKANAAEHHRLGTNAQTVVNKYQSQGVQDTPKHHADLTLHYEQNQQNPSYAGGQRHPLQPNWRTLRNVHNPKSGNWDEHYGVSPEIQHDKPDVKAAYKQKYGRTGSEKTFGSGATEKTEVSRAGATVGKSVADGVSEMDKAVSSYQIRRLKESAANSLFHHHLSKIRGEHQEADRHLTAATEASKKAGSGPTPKMMDAHVQIHKKELDHARRVSGGPGVQTGGGRMIGGSATLHKMAEEGHQAAQQARNHPLVGAKFEKSLRADLVYVNRPLKPKF